MTTTNVTSGALTQHERDRFRAAISTARVRPFLVVLDRSSGSGAEVNVHVAKDAGRPARRDLHRQISALGQNISVRVKLHGRRALDKSRSLEQFIAKFPGERICDPIGVFDEAERLVNAAHELRRRLADGIRGVYWNSRSRTTYAVLNEKAFTDGYCLLRQKLAAAEQTVVNAYETNIGNVAAARTDHTLNGPAARSEGARFNSVRLCFEIPAVPLVPVDEGSILNEPTRYGLIPTLLSLAKSRALARVPLLTLFFGVGSANLAFGKVTATGDMPEVNPAKTAAAVSAGRPPGSVKSLPDGAVALPSGANDPYPGGPGLHLLWRDPIHGPIGQSVVPQQPAAGPQLSDNQASSLDAREGMIDRDQFRQVASSGATFSGPVLIGQSAKLDLQWVSDGALRISGPQDDRPTSTVSHVMQSGIAALPGLSKLMRSTSSDEAYAAIVEEMGLHFGLPRSLQIEKRWHFDDATQSWVLLHRGGESPDRRERDSWNWLRRMDVSHLRIDGGYYERWRPSDNTVVAEQKKTKKKPPRGSS